MAGKKGGKKKKGPELILVHKREKRWKRVLRKPKELLPTEAFESPGVVTFTMSRLVQKNLECIVTVDVTAEIPWKYVHKDLITASLELFGEESEFHPFAAEIIAYPHEKMLFCYKPDDAADTDEFYMCITEEAEKLISSVIANILKERQEDLDRSVNKPVRPWETLGSDEEIYNLNDHNSRSLLLVELQMKFPIIRYPEEILRHLKLRLVEDARDGYIETLSKRTTFQPLISIQQDAQVQAAPIYAENETQTIAVYNSYPRNKYCQYLFELPPLKKLTKRFTHNITWFMDHELEKLTYILDINGKMNLYTPDYLNLVRDVESSSLKDIAILQPFSFIMDTKYVKGKQIASVAWHKMWTGIAAVAYTDYAQCSYRKYNSTRDEVIDAIYHVPPVLLWSFTDTVEPKLILETPREIVILDFCPYDETILVGGCINGQIIVWDLTNRIEKLETTPILTLERQHYRLVMNSMTQWFKRNSNIKLVRDTISSDLQYSHSSAVTGIQWINAFEEINKNGKMQAVPDTENRTTLQFITSSRDGSVLYWDLNAQPQYKGSRKPKRKLRRLPKCPSALTQDVSPYRILNRLMKPLFRVDVIAPNSTRPFALSEIRLDPTRTKYEDSDPHSNKDDITKRNIFRAFLQKPKRPLRQKFLAATTEGHVVLAEWEGFDYNSGAAVNKENCKIQTISQYHDGPVVSLSRSLLDEGLILSVGGKVFALWMSAFPSKPLMWRRCVGSRYTQGAWLLYRRSMFRLTRSDGCLEGWNFAYKSNGCVSIKNISGNSLTGSYTHSLPLKRNILGIGDSNGTLRLYFITAGLNTDVPSHQEFILRLFQRAVDRKTKFEMWQQDWTARNAGKIEAVDFKKEDYEEKSKEALVEEVVEEETETRKPAKAGDYWETIRRELYEREIDIVQRAILRNKGLDKEVLVKQQQPLLIVQKEEEKLKEKLQARLKKSKKVYDVAIRTLFPDVVYKEPPPPKDPHRHKGNEDQEFEYFQSYLDMAPNLKEDVQENPYSYYFNMLDVLKRGKNRRQQLQKDYYKCSHKHRIPREKKEQEEREERAKEASQRAAQKASLSSELSLYIVVPDLPDGSEDEIVSEVEDA